MPTDVLNCLQSTLVTLIHIYQHDFSFIYHIHIDVHGFDSIAVHLANTLTCPTTTLSCYTMRRIVNYINSS